MPKTDTLNPIPFDRSAVIRDIYISKELSVALNKMQPASLREDLKQEMFMVLCEMPADEFEDKFKKGYLMWYLVRTMLNMIKSNRSTFARKFRALHNEPDKYRNSKNPTPTMTKYFSQVPRALYPDLPEYPEIDPCDLLERVGPVVDGLHFYEAGLLRLYAENGNSCTPVAKQTGIPVRSVRIAVTAAKRKARKLLRA